MMAPGVVRINDSRFPAWPLAGGRFLVDLRILSDDCAVPQFQPWLLTAYCRLDPQLIIAADESEPRGFVVL